MRAIFRPRCPGRPVNRTTVFRVIQANALLGMAREVLADFEAELIEEVAGRVRENLAAVVTAAEWAVIDDAVAAMRSALRDAGPAGLAA